MVALIFLAALILFIAADIIIIYRKKQRDPTYAVRMARLKGKKIIPGMYDFPVPKGILLSKSHTWMKEVGDGKVKIGIDDFILKTLGELKILKVKDTGDLVKMGEVIFEAKSNNKTLKFRSPVDGFIEGYNNLILDNSVKDPYGKDWAVLLLPRELEKNKSYLIAGSELAKWIREEVGRFKDFIAAKGSELPAAGITMADGGEIPTGIMSRLSGETWCEFEKEFLTQSLNVSN